MALGLLHVARNVKKLERACEFYSTALGFSLEAGPVRNPALAALLGVESAATARLRLGAQVLELNECEPAGAPYPRDAQADDGVFQHIAIVTTHIHRAAAQALAGGASAISASGPVLLPAASGGAWAWKFRDPDGHPLELLQFPAGAPWHGTALHLGYDHTAIRVADAARGIAFYRALGLRLRHRHVNQGVEQDRLDGLAPSVVEVVALAPPEAPPHVELLAYAGGRPAFEMRPNDIAADRLVFGDGCGAAVLARDPDGHFLLLERDDMKSNHFMVRLHV